MTECARSAVMMDGELSKYVVASCVPADGAFMKTLQLAAGQPGFP